MEGVVAIGILTMVTVNICGLVYIGKTFTEFIYKVIHYILSSGERRIAEKTPATM